MRYLVEDYEDDILDDTTVIETGNPYITDSVLAKELIAALINKNSTGFEASKKAIMRKVQAIYQLFSEISFDGEMESHRKLDVLCERLAEQQKIRKIKDKVVIGLGGKFSAGKSKFINSISGCGDLLPEAQSPTTSIPTYVISDEMSRFIANSVHGTSCTLNLEQLQALTHEFYDTYKISFASFVESIIVQVDNYALDPGIALLDTPGYTKYDNKSDSKQTMSDRNKAMQQLRVVDYLIWLVDIDNGILTQDDLKFIENLRVKNPILIVLNKADKKPPEDREQILKACIDVIHETNIPCYGVTAYSSVTGEEFNDTPIIPAFFEMTLSQKLHGNDLLGQLQVLEDELQSQIISKKNEYYNITKILFDIIGQSEQFLELKSVVALWRKNNMICKQYSRILERLKIETGELNKLVQAFISEESR